MSVPTHRGTPSPRRRAVLLRRARRRQTAVVLHRQRRRRGLIVAAIMAPLVTLAGLAVAAALAFMPAVQAMAGRPPAARTFPADTLVLDRHGKLIADVHQPGVSRIPVELTGVSQPMQDATVDIEDRNFWTEGSVDPARLAGAAWNDVRYHTSQGGSTIPMQLAKLLYLTDDRSFQYKVREIAFANLLLQKMSKSDILDAYLNDIPFGESAYGVEAAAHVYFGIPASKLDLAQAAMLAGLPNAPGSDDPFLHPQAAHTRQLAVLDAMVQTGDITPAERQRAAAEPLHLADGNADNIDVAPEFTGRVIGELATALQTDVATAGLRVVSTLDLGLEQQARDVIATQIHKIRALNVSDAALVSVDPASGEVLAYVGNAGPAAPGWQIDMAAHPRQIGSSFKLFTYSTAIAERRISMLTPVLDGPISIPLPEGVYKPNDYDHKWHGMVPIELALGNSLNIPAIRVELAAGIANIVETARKLGVTTLTADPSSYGPSMTLGTYAVPVWQLAQAATALAGAGVLHHAYFVQSATDSSGRVVYKGGSPGVPALDPGVAFVMNAILTNDSNRVMEFGPRSALTLPGHLVSAKTGTTDDFRDNLTVGWTPHLVTATWVGNADDAPMHGTTGVTGAAPIWHDFMDAALRGVPDNWPPAPPDVTHQGAGWFLTGTSAKTTVPVLTQRGTISIGAGGGAASGTTSVSYAHGCRYWIYNGVHYWWCGSGSSGLPGDPG